MLQFGIMAASLVTGEVALYDPKALISPAGQQQQQAQNATIHSWQPSPDSKVWFAQYSQESRTCKVRHCGDTRAYLCTCLGCSYDQRRSRADT